ncbi:hypothetical protein L286_23590 [Sphingobium sp. HDIP04]|nr:hypothetical protein L286_23590 [Sphingobium sp. HDIP04]
MVGFINMKRFFDVSRIPDTPGDIAAGAARAAPDFNSLPQVERDRRVRAAMEAASW